MFVCFLLFPAAFTSYTFSKHTSCCDGSFSLPFPKTKQTSARRSQQQGQMVQIVRCCCHHHRTTTSNVRCTRNFEQKTRVVELNVFACLDLLPSLLAASHHRGIYVCSFLFANVLRARLYAVARLHFGVIFNAVIYADAIIDYGQWPSQ